MLSRFEIDLIILAGYTKKLLPRTLRLFSGRIINIHPSLLPKFGGKGMYGRRVHEAVLAAGEKESGITIHLVETEYDSGAIIAQLRQPILSDDTPDTLAERLLVAENSFLVETVARIASGDLLLPGLD